MMLLTLWAEKIAGKGEDAFPASLIDEENGTGIIAVADGLGGAGSTPYEIGEKVFSGAYLASRLAIQIAEQTFVEENPDLENFIQKLQNNLLLGFQLKIAQLDDRRSKLRTRLIKRLPTTLAGVVFKVQEGATMAENVYQTEVFWAGDSRVYVLKKSGLQQISQDNLTQDLDAFENLLQDAPISNCINAEGDFQLFSKKSIFNEPIVLIAATDGCFGYLPTPLHFEYYLLATLHHLQICTLEMWQQALLWAFEANAGDDISLALVTLGFASFEELKFATIDRFVSLKKLIFSDKTPQQQWEEYKKDYYETAILL
ncbi:PP2C family protein-serine/threonine phosphatase [Raineya orbicola]|uniref:Protein phosphatase 2C n=1 Tax=Raineya orbicola TaxID=2016530 RepID=A0A2N3IIR0_9BACT|nr:protein phosphatase 2C domain-containing protein [Raineya orbicola]PKQ70222.1 Protein phosphatase 2C [Raineya orbicola]